MHAMNASGCRVSLLNHETPSPKEYVAPSFLTGETREKQHQIAPARTDNSHGTSMRTPDLLQSESDDSQVTNKSDEPATPLTQFFVEPGLQDAYTARYDWRPYANYPQKAMPQSSTIAVASAILEHTSSFNEDDQSLSESSSLRKRCPCRFKDTHGCEKTFTTSGHASRHSKIHTAKKCVQCSFQGCHKKFTRTDNMKHHLETHSKDRSRSSSSSYTSSSSSAMGKPTLPPRIEKPSVRVSRLEPRPINTSVAYVDSSTSEVSDT